MARRRDDEDEGLLGEIFDLLLVAPIWVGPVVLRLQPVPAVEGDRDVGDAC